MHSLNFAPVFEPVNTTLKTVLLRLRAGEHVRVVLEPGDMTRYELLLVPQTGDYVDTLTGNTDRHMIVMRANGSMLSAVIVRMYKGDYWAGGFTPISNNNEHTAQVFAEFFEFLMGQML